jgi:CheY-like chemotaxis protein
MEDKLIMIVEDSPTQLKVLKRILEGAGFQNISEAADGRQALDMLSAKAPSLIISDVDMPNMNGFELCEALKSDDGLKDIPCILLTASNDPLAHSRGLNFGANALLRKPYDKDSLLFLVKRLLKKHNQD